MSVVKHGRILRDTSVKDGLVLVEKQQYLFRLEGMWAGDVAPKVNMLIEAEFNDRGQLATLRPASVQDTAADEAARKVTAAKVAAKATAKQVANDVRDEGVPALVEQARKIGYSTLAAAAAVLLGWFYFPVASTQLGAGGRLSFTFYQVVKLLNVQGVQDLMNFVAGGGAGLYGLFCFASLLAVALPWVWRDRRAGFGMMAPVLFMLVVAILAHYRVNAQMQSLQATATDLGSHAGAQGRAWATQTASQVADQVRDSISLGFGAWLSLLGGAYLAWNGWRRVTTAADAHEPAHEAGEPA